MTRKRSSQPQPPPDERAVSVASPESLHDLPVSPSTNLDPEVRQFMSRVMTGYESAHRSIVTLCETMASRAEKAEGIAARSLELQMKLAEEREELISKRHRRELEAKLAEAKGETVREIGRDIRSLGFLLAKRFAGLPLSGNDSHGLTDLLKTLSPDQIESLISDGRLELSVPQRHLLGAAIQSLSDSEAKPEAAE